MRSPAILPALAAEALGAFTLVFAGCGAIALGTLSPAGIAASFGLAIMVMVFAFGRVSGAHFNPAVTLAFAAGRHFPVARVAPYWLAQTSGAVVAALALRLTLGDGVSLGVTQPSGGAVQSLVWEGILTFVLVLVILSVAIGSRDVGPWAAVAIGGAVALGSLVGGPVSGASMNPARSIGPAVVSGDLGDLWIYIVGPTIGALAAVIAYRYVALPRSS